MTPEELRRRIVEKYDVEELVEMLGLTPEDIYDQHWDYGKHWHLFGDVVTEMDTIDG